MSESITKGVKEGDLVEFELEETDRGIQAANLRVI